MPWLVLENLRKPMSSHWLPLWHPFHFVLPSFTSSHLDPKVRVGMVLTLPQDDPWTATGPLDREVKERGVPLACPLPARMIGHCSDFVEYAEVQKLSLIRVSGNTYLLPLEVSSVHRKEAFIVMLH